MKPILKLLTALTVATAAVGSAHASPITSFGGLTGATQTIDFSQFDGSTTSGVNGPVQIGGLIGRDVTVQDMLSGNNIWLYNSNWGLSNNGTWNSGRNGFLGIFPTEGPLRIRFNDGPISGFAAFMNYPIDLHSASLAAYDSGGNLLELFDISTAPINTPGATNDGAVRGIQLATNNIAYIELTGDAAVFDDLTFTSAAAVAVPEPATIALFGTGLLGLGALRRRRKAKA